MIDDFTTLFWLLVGHALADYPLQGDFVARFKARVVEGRPNPMWPWILGAHALIHGGMVALLTGRVELGLAEVVLHWTIDWLKCEGAIDFNADQTMHVACKVAWMGLS